MSKPNFSAQLPDRTISQIEALKPLYNGNKTQIVIDAINRMYNQEIKTMKTYTNIDERYGEQTQATIADYQELNPDGKFIEIHGEIRELLSDTPGDYEVVAVEQESLTPNTTVTNS